MNSEIRFWKNMKSLMARAWQIKKLRDQDRDASGAFFIVCLFPLCLKMAWDEFKNNELWIPIEEAIERSGKRMRIVYYWLQGGQVIGQKVLNKWWVDLASLEDYLERRADSLVRDGYLTLKEAADKIGKTYMFLWRAVTGGQLEGKEVDGQWLVHKEVLCTYN